MALVDTLTGTAPEAVWLFKAIGTGTFARSSTANEVQEISQNESLFFQYWPASLQDDYQVEYAEHSIPGGTHPLYQWVSGRGRTITFQAVFTSEVNTKRSLGNFSGTVAAAGARGLADLSPSAPYTVDVAAGLSMLRSWMRPKYAEDAGLGTTAPPPILTLVLPGTEINGKNKDSINVILRAAPITYEAWFPNGQPRVATVDLTFSEVVQVGRPSEDGAGATVKFIDRTNMLDHGEDYRAPAFSLRSAAGSGG